MTEQELKQELSSMKKNDLLHLIEGLMEDNVVDITDINLCHTRALESKTKWDDELLMVITWFSRIKQMATDMTTYNNHVMNPKECLCEISILAKESIEFIHNNFLNKKKEEQQ